VQLEVGREREIEGEVGERVGLGSRVEGIVGTINDRF
jgi:hypothetical protein